jgi:hypothetical protein
MRKLAIAFVAIAALSGPTGAAAYTSHAYRHHAGAATRYGLRSGGLGTLPAAGYADHHFGVGSVPASGWNQGGFGGTRNPGMGYSFGPQLGGIGH